LKRLFGGKPLPPPPPVRRPFGYAPAIASAKPLARYRVAGREAVLLGDVVAAGRVEYLYILAVYDPDGEPCLFVASEVNAMHATFGGGSHFLGVFPGEGHFNMGDSDEWADRERFTERALAIARERLGGG
jgi:hypothetical protein